MTERENFVVEEGQKVHTLSGIIEISEAIYMVQPRVGVGNLEYWINSLHTVCKIRNFGIE
jgi:hypothetical protein